MGHRSGVNCAVVTLDGQHLISGSYDKTIKVWDLKKRRELFTLNGHTDPVLTVAVMPDGKRILSGSWDKTFKVWDLHTQEVMASFIGDGAFLCCAVAPDDMTIVAGEASGRLHFLRLEEE